VSAGDAPVAEWMMTTIYPAVAGMDDGSPPFGFAVASERRQRRLSYTGFRTLNFKAKVSKLIV